MNDDILVSVCCMTYNHEKYIKQTLDGFVNQKTNFKFEVLVHDDASTDNTQKIIKEYEKKYPNIIKGIYEKENQYSKVGKILPLVLGKIKGKYFALCEGDDYWCDENKLQMQVDIMEKDENITLCFHDSKIITDSNQNVEKFFWSQKYDGYIPTEMFIEEGGQFCPTASLMFRSKNMKKLPDYYMKSSVGDYPLQVYNSSCGKSYYINKKMCAYRYIINGNSWSSNFNKYIEKRISNHLNEIEWLLMFNEETSEKYKKSVYKRICFNYINLINLDKKNKKDYLKKYKNYSKIIGSKSKMKNKYLIFKALFPKKIKKFIKKIIGKENE